MSNRCGFLVFALSAGLLAAGAQPATAQNPLPDYASIVDLAVPVGSMTLELRREVAFESPRPAGAAAAGAGRAALLGSRWTLVLAGFGDPIAVDGGPPAAIAPAMRPLFTDTFDPQNRLVARADRRGNVVRFAYDAAGRVTRIDGPKGSAIAFVFDAAGRATAVRARTGDVAYVYSGDDLAEVRRNAGPAVRYAYGAARGPIRVDDPLTGPVDIAYDLVGRVTSYRWADGAVQRFEYDDRTGIERQIDPVGAATTVKRGRATEITDAAGHTWTIAYDPATRVRTETAPNGAITRTTVDERGRIVAVVDPLDRKTAYEYDVASGLLTAIVQPDGTRRTYDYDAAGSLLAERVGTLLVRSISYNQDGTVATFRARGSGERRFTYTTEGRVRTIADALGAATTFEYDARGRIVQETNPLGGITLRTYDAQDRLLTETNPSGGTTRYRYDDRGRLAETTDAGGGVTRYDYDSRGRVVAIIDALGSSTRYAYDVAGRLSRITHPDGGTETFAYDPLGHRIQTTDASGATAESRYDAVGRLVAQRLGTGLEIQYDYDVAGRLVGRSDNSGASERRELAGQGWIVAATTGGSASRYEYDAAGSLTAVVDPLGHARRLTYAPEGWLVAARDPAGAEGRYVYDAAGRLVSVTRSTGGTTRFTYDALGNVVGTAAPDEAQRRYVYDAAGRRTAAIDEAGRTSSMTYDQRWQLAEHVLPDGAKLTFRYDALGRLVQADDGRFPVRLAYDVMGRVTATEYPAIGKSVRAEFNARGQRTKLIDPGGREIGYAYDAVGQLSAIELPDRSRVVFAYDRKARLQSIGYPNGVTGRWVYDSQDRLTQVSYSDRAGLPLMAAAYTYDVAGNVVERRDHRQQAVQYAYDPSGQLVEERAGGSATRYRYAEGTNRVERTRNGTTTTYRYDAADRVVAAQPAGGLAEIISYDKRGLPIRRSAGTAETRYDFDALGQLTRVAAAGGATTSYGYSATGGRISRRDAQGLTYLLSDGVNLFQEVGEDLRPRATFVHAPGVDRPVAMLLNGQVYFFHADRLGSIRLLTDSQGRAVSTYDYDAFGGFRVRDETVRSPFGYTGREREPNGLYNYRARYYDPELGRFLSPDPAPLRLDRPLRLNAYAYAANNPMRFVDPFGLWEVDWAAFKDVGLWQTPEEALEYFRTVASRPGDHVDANRYLPKLESIVRERARLGLTPPDAPRGGLTSPRQPAPGGPPPPPRPAPLNEMAIPTADAPGPGMSRPEPTVDAQPPRPAAAGPPGGARGWINQNGGGILLFLSAADFAICLANYSATECFQRFLAGSVVGAVAGRYLVAAAIPGGPIVGVIVVGATLLYQGYDVYQSYQGAARAMLQADAATIAQVNQLNDRIVGTGPNSLRKLAERITEAAEAADRRLREAERLNDELKRLLDDVASQIASGKLSASDDCKNAAALQAKLPGIKVEANRRKVDINRLIDEALAIARLCKTKVDADNITYRYDTAQRLKNELDALQQQAKDIVDELNPLIAKIAGQASGLQAANNQLMARMPDMSKPLDAIAVAVADGKRASDLLEQFRAARERAVEDIAAAKKNYENQSWQESVVDLFRRDRLDVAGELRRTRELLEQIPMPRSAVSDDFSIDVDTAFKRAIRIGLDATERQIELLALHCSFTSDNLQDFLNELKYVVNDSQAVFNVGRTLPATAAQCSASAGPGTGGGQPPPQGPPIVQPTRPTPPDPTPPPPAGGGVQYDPGPPKVLKATLDCGPILELTPAAMSKTCNVIVTGWLSNTTVPVEVIVGPLLPGLRASPGDTQVAGSSMYAAGVSNRADQYVFSQGFSATANAAPGTSQALLIMVRQQGHGVTLLPLTLNVVAKGAPPGVTISPPVPEVTGSGGGFCVWQYKLFGDPAECWNFAAAVCTNPRYAGRAEYIRVGNDMSWAEADGQIGQLSSYFSDTYGCRPKVDKPATPPPPPAINQQGSGGNYCVWRYKMFGDPPQCFHFAAAACGRYGAPYELVGSNMTSGQADARITEMSRFFNDAYGCRATATPTTQPPPQPPPNTPNPNPPTPPPPTPPVAPTPPSGRPLSRFGIAPANITVKPGDTVRLKAFGIYTDAPNDIVEITAVRWSGDKPPVFTAASGDLGRTFVISVAGLDGATDSTTVRVAAQTSLTDDLLSQPPIPVPPGAPPLGAPAPPRPPATAAPPPAGTAGPGSRIDLTALSGVFEADNLGRGYRFSGGVGTFSISYAYDSGWGRTSTGSYSNCRVEAPRATDLDSTVAHLTCAWEQTHLDGMKRAVSKGTAVLKVETGSGDQMLLVRGTVKIEDHQFTWHDGVVRGPGASVLEKGNEFSVTWDYWRKR